MKLPMAHKNTANLSVIGTLNRIGGDIKQNLKKRQVSVSYDGELRTPAQDNPYVGGRGTNTGEDLWPTNMLTYGHHWQIRASHACLIY